MIKTTALAVTLAACAGLSNAAVSGNFAGPASTFGIDLLLSNDGPGSILSLVLDGSTGDAFPILWDSVGTPGGTAVVNTTAGVDTQIVTWTFAAFGVGDTFNLTGMDPDADPGPSGVTADELAGVTLTATYSDNSIFSGVFMSDPTGRLGPILEGVTTPVPLPAALPLLAVALGGLSVAATRRKQF